MKIKQLLGMMALDSNANEIGKIEDAEFDKEDGKISSITIVLKKNIISSNKIEVGFEDIKNIGDYVLLNIEINKEAAIEEAEKAKKAAKEDTNEEKVAEKVETVEAELVDDVGEEVEDRADVKIE
ncbi:PRC-barrel domain-containing protein [Methanobrevibacter olleyae]|uniref:PRC-barrel domain-containing protein n=1 Tax=Methanobrevibacter olleyae TaxID=294671 RepID=A0A126R0U8_METOL|nr:PRC-barrel domain-containing protein [Methanobrevibacter olleyae]AMK15708.1 hypothetical protein YLM1_1151 [Methanobrevibacter olleyae]SFL22569.1 PRC-barrel domain-containing protein [Methanobrevibacter olleyae]